MNDTDQLNALLRQHYNALDGRNQEAISTTDLANEAFKSLDPTFVSPSLVRLAAVLELKQLARAICREKQAMDEQATEQGSLFDMQLQPRYPARRNDDDAYVLRACLTLEERRLNIKRLRNEANAKMAHADALEAETDVLVRQGKLSEMAATP